MEKKKFEQSITLPSSVLQNAKKEELHVILNPYRGIHNVPAELRSGDEATLVFVGLQDCFQKQGFVAEGMMANIIWGFRECGYGERHVAAGLTKLRALGYIKYTDENLIPVHEFNFDPNKPVWIRYTEKFRKLLIYA